MKKYILILATIYSTIDASEQKITNYNNKKQELLIELELQTLKTLTEIASPSSLPSVQLHMNSVLAYCCPGLLTSRMDSATNALKVISTCQETSRKSCIEILHFIGEMKRS